jgi:hypothetical protein
VRRNRDLVRSLESLANVIPPIPASCFALVGVGRRETLPRSSAGPLSLIRVRPVDSGDAFRTRDVHLAWGWLNRAVSWLLGATRLGSCASAGPSELHVLFLATEESNNIMMCSRILSWRCSVVVGLSWDRKTFVRISRLNLKGYELPLCLCLLELFSGAHLDTA